MVSNFLSASVHLIVWEGSHPSSQVSPIAGVGLHRLEDQRVLGFLQHIQQSLPDFCFDQYLVSVQYILQSILCKYIVSTSSFYQVER